MDAIRTISLEKSYLVGFWRKLSKQALKPLTLEVREGEIFGYLGPNGAGKTTTLRLLMGLVKPTSGSATILGGTIQDPAIRAQIGFLPEQPYFYDYLTAMELLNYYAQLSGVPAGERKQRITVSSIELALRKTPSTRNCASFLRGCCSASESPKPFCTIPSSCFWTSRCPASILSGVMKFAT